MSTTVGDNIPECFPPWPKDWCKAPGSQPPPPWAPNDQRGDQTAGAAFASSVPVWLFYGALALLVFWLGVRALEAYAAIRD